MLKGSGLSSSAAYEVLIGTILNGLYNEGEVSAVEIAQIAQFAENVYFGKPSGLMDQMASSVGGFITIDFADEKHPVINSVKFDFTKSGHALCIVDTKGNHADLTPEYLKVEETGFFDPETDLGGIREIYSCDFGANTTWMLQIELTHAISDLWYEEINK